MAPDLDCISPTLYMEGYLKKPKKWSKRYFVIREGPSPCLEYYDSHRRKSSGKPKKVIKLSDAWNIGKKVSAKHKYLIGIYTAKEYFCMAAENENSQTNWVNALRQAALFQRGTQSQLHAMYKYIWQGSVDTKDLKDCDPQKKFSLQGPHRCCLTDKTMVFIPVDCYGGCNVEARAYVDITIASIRACGHKDNVFFMEPGRSSGIGVGQLRIELDDYAIAENMHMTILETWSTSKALDDMRPRSQTYGSSNSRQVNNHRSRQNYYPPPRQVGLNKPYAPNVPKMPAPDHDIRKWLTVGAANKFPHDDRDRASSEGETAMRRKMRQTHQVYSSRVCYQSHQNGSTSPQPRFRCKGTFPPPSSAPHSRTSSLPGSFPSSRNSSAEHIAMSSSDFVSGIEQNLASEYVEPSLIPPPPSTPPATPPAHLLLHQTHSRSHSFDGSSSLSASSLSTSPCNGNNVSAGTSPSLFGNFLRGSSPLNEISSSRSKEILETSDYTLMNPGRAFTGFEDGNVYVPMVPLQRSQPQEILNSRPLFTDDLSYGTYSPASPNRSPDKNHHNRRNFRNGSCEGSCGSSPSSLTQRSTQTLQSLCHGLKESTVNGQTTKSHVNESMVYFNDYASMSDFPPCSSNESSSNKSPTIDDEYLPMSPVAAVCSKNVVVGNVIAVAQSVRDKSNVSQAHSRRYPHEIFSNRDKTTPPRRRYTVSSGIPLHWLRSSRDTKYSRRGSTRLDSKSPDSPPLSPGGEYVSIDYDKAKKQVGPEYVSLTEPEADEECWSHSEDSNEMIKVTHDSNRNILPNVESTTKDENQYPK